MPSNIKAILKYSSLKGKLSPETLQRIQTLYMKILANSHSSSAAETHLKQLWKITRKVLANWNLHREYIQILEDTLRDYIYTYCYFELQIDLLKEFKSLRMILESVS